MELLSLTSFTFGIVIAEILTKIFNPQTFLEINLEKINKKIKFRIHHLHFGALISFFAFLSGQIYLFLFSAGIMFHDLIVEINKKTKIKKRIFLYAFLLFLFFPLLSFPQINLLEINQYIDNNQKIKNEIAIYTNETEFEISFLDIKISNFNFDKNLDCKILEQTIFCKVLNKTNKYNLSFDSEIKNIYELKFSSNKEIKIFSLIITLHEDFFIKENSTIPKPKTIASDGKRIILYYDIRDLKKDIVYTIKFELERRPKIAPFDWLITAIIFIVIVAIVLIYYHFRNTYKKRFESFLALMDKNEKKVLEILLKHNQIDQRKIVKETGFSKSLVSKIIKSFKERGLIKVERRGRTNIIQLIKKPII